MIRNIHIHFKWIQTHTIQFVQWHTQFNVYLLSEKKKEKIKISSKPWFLVFANVCDVNTPTSASLKLPTRDWLDPAHHSIYMCIYICVWVCICVLLHTYVFTSTHIYIQCIHSMYYIFCTYVHYVCVLYILQISKRRKVFLKLEIQW